MATYRIAGYKESERRRDRRLPRGNLRFEIGAALCRVIDISLGGFRIEAPAESPRAGDRFQVTLILCDDGRRAAVGLEAEVVRADAAAGTLSARFVNLNGARFRVLEQLVLRGRLPRV